MVRATTTGWIAAMNDITYDVCRFLLHYLANEAGQQNTREFRAMLVEKYGPEAAEKMIPAALLVPTENAFSPASGEDLPFSI